VTTLLRKLFDPESEKAVSNSIDVSTTGKHISALDGVRGLAILLVFMVHIFGMGTNSGSRLMRLQSRIFSAGWIGVDMFFALSGFLITGILYDTLGSRRFFLNFYARRSLRVFPLYYGYILTIMLIVLALRGHWYSRLGLYLTYTSNLDRSLGRYTTAPWVNFGHFWSLAVEEQFYLFWPVAVFLLRRKRYILIASLTLAAMSFGIRCYIQFSGVCRALPISGLHLDARPSGYPTAGSSARHRHSFTTAR